MSIDASPCCGRWPCAWYTAGCPHKTSATPVHTETMLPQGWQCPVCKKVLAPHVNECGHQYTAHAQLGFKP